jgi:hypothetical protein
MLISLEDRVGRNGSDEMLVRVEHLLECWRSLLFMYLEARLFEQGYERRRSQSFNSRKNEWKKRGGTVDFSKANNQGAAR